jgi:hypothetical protein
MSQILIVLLALPLTIRIPSGLKLTLETPLECPLARRYFKPFNQLAG